MRSAGAHDETMNSQPTSAPGPVVVGVDGSPNSIEALKMAIHEAQWRSVPLKAIISWQYPSSYGIEGMGFAMTDPRLEDEARGVLANAVAQACPNNADRSKIEQIATFGTPAKVLIDASEGASLLVVGARGHGGFMGLLMGSSSTQVAHHAHCPVLIVPQPDR